MRRMLPIEDVPASTPLLRGLSADERARALDMLRACYIAFDAGDPIRRSDSERRCAAYLAEGLAEAFVIDDGGSRSILHLFVPGQLLANGKVFGDLPLPLFELVAREPCRVVIVSADHLPAEGRPACVDKVKDNLARSVAALDAELMATLYIRMRRTVRGKVMAYLDRAAARLGRRSVDVVLNRQELADYLCVDRASLSRELGAMRDEGLLRFERSHFELLWPAPAPNGPEEAGGRPEGR